MIIADCEFILGLLLVAIGLCSLGAVIAAVIDCYTRKDHDSGR